MSPAQPSPTFHDVLMKSFTPPGGGRVEISCPVTIRIILPLSVSFSFCNSEILIKHEQLHSALASPRRTAAATEL